MADIVGDLRADVGDLLGSVGKECRSARCLGDRGERLPRVLGGGLFFVGEQPNGIDHDV